MIEGQASNQQRTRGHRRAAIQLCEAPLFVAAALRFVKRLYALTVDVHANLRWRNAVIAKFIDDQRGNFDTPGRAQFLLEPLSDLRFADRGRLLHGAGLIKTQARPERLPRALDKIQHVRGAYRVDVKREVERRGNHRPALAAKVCAEERVQRGLVRRGRHGTQTGTGRMSGGIRIGPCSGGSR
jgi:hypothetical protein